MSDDPMLIFEVDAERRKLRACEADNAALRAKWDSVPWDAIYYAIDRMASYAPESKAHLMDALDNFYQAYGPKEAA